PFRHCSTTPNDNHTASMNACRVLCYFTIYDIDNRAGYDQPSTIKTAILGSGKGNVACPTASRLSMFDGKALQNNLLSGLNRSCYGNGMIYLSSRGVSTQDRFVQRWIRHRSR